ncbi:MAG: hypothetical protein IKS33_07145 [Bacteroidales bacterium]|nr:hypothetical protein [Bacteroidales bacterium]MBR4454017.1 hypothetical protein [Bacteroidales bacterium]
MNKEKFLIKLSVIAFVVISLFSNVYADNGKRIIGARANGMSDVSVSIVDFWSCANNQATLGFYERIAVGASYDNKFLLKNTSIASVGVVVPVKKIGVISCNMQFYGGTGYGNFLVGLCYSRSFGKVISASLQFDYLLNYFGDAYYGKRNGFTFEIGLYGRVTKNFSLGFHVYNPARLRMITYNDVKEYIPTVFRLGGSYRFGEKCLLGIDLIKDLDTRFQVATGLEYRFADYLVLRGGVKFPDFSFSLGLGTQVKGIQIDISSSYHTVLGYSPQLSIVYQIK